MLKSTKNLVNEKTQLSAFSVTNAQKPAPPKRCIKALLGGAHIAPFSTLYKSTQLLCLNPLTLKSSYERWNSVIPIFCGLVDYSIFWDCSVCDVSERTVAVLVSGNSGGNVPGRNPGTFQILFYQDHTCRENRRIFWTYGHMWERRFLPWYDRDQPCFTINRTSKYRSGSDFVVFYIGYDRI